MVMVLEDYKEFEALKAKIEKQVDWFTDHPVAGNPRVQLVDEPEAEGLPHPSRADAL